MYAVEAFVATLPTRAFLLVLAGWLAGTLAATFVAAKIGRTAIMAIYVVATITGAMLGWPHRCSNQSS